MFYNMCDVMVEGRLALRVYGYIPEKEDFGACFLDGVVSE